ncbi:MAG: TonB-dependent receptor [Bryobacteraceae bacterium]|nr:TonB-dependent receptor [Bryobacteraceae bacterium]
MSPSILAAFIAQTVTVTADRTTPLDVQAAAQVVAVHEREWFADRPLTTVADMLRGDAGILVQNTTTAQVSPFLRGLTGYQVLNLLDGVRYNNATFRSGPNQYLALIEPSQARAIEAVLGPAAAEYGSDALGGVIQVLTPQAKFTDTREAHGSFELGGGTADWSARSNAQLQVTGARIAWLVGGSVFRPQDLRAGGATDSRHTLRRLFGLNDDQIRSITGDQQQDTAFTQAGAHTKLAFRPSDNSTLTAWYQHSTQSGVRNYKDLWGGLGRMQSSFSPQSVDLLYLRGERAKIWGLESLAGTFSLNRQRDGSTRQGLRSTDSVTNDDVTVNALGYTGQGRATLGGRQALAFGGEFYDESIFAARLTGGRAQRPLYPDDSRYRTGALFAQDAIELFSRRVRLTGGLRWTRAGYRTQAGAFGVAASDESFHDVTYNWSALWQVTRRFGVHFLNGRGFRAPNANDLGVVGLNDLGYEVPASAAASAGALLSTSSGEGATSSGRTLSALKPESLQNYEAGIRWTSSKVYARVQGFWADLRDPIVRRTLLFPANNVPTTLAGQAVTRIAPTPAQSAQGVVTVATAIDPRAVKSFVNDGRSRYYGLESIVSLRPNGAWLIDAGYTYLVGRDLNPNRNIRRLPPQFGTLRARYQTRFAGLWVESMLTATGAQNRLSGGDIDDERIGASRRRQDIADFFNGSRIAPYVMDGRFTPTGETLFQIQNRVLPGVDNATRVPMYTSTAGWATVDLRVGIPVTDYLTITGGAMNVADRNYRVHGSGTDAPGRSLFAAARFVW